MNIIEKFINPNNKKNARPHQSENKQNFYGHGKLLLTGEYFVLNGSKSLALPVKLGQSLNVEYSPSFNPALYWKSFDVMGNLWFECKMEFWHFDFLDDSADETAITLQQILRQVRKQNSHFLRDDVDVHVETRLGFPLNWGLGSSSSLIYNIAQWAYISPFELLFETLGGSGYDIACAQSDGPILYEKSKHGPNWSPTKFDPPFKDSLYFLYLGDKQNTLEGIKHFNSLGSFKKTVYQNISNITEKILTATSLDEFEKSIKEHEQIISENLKMETVKSKFFEDYSGEIKSLGAWGGDFVLVTGSEDYQEVKKYFDSKNYDTLIPYRDLILEDSLQATHNRSWDQSGLIQ